MGGHSPSRRPRKALLRTGSKPLNAELRSADRSILRSSPALRNRATAEGGLLRRRSDRRLPATVSLIQQRGAIDIRTMQPHAPRAGKHSTNAQCSRAKNRSPSNFRHTRPGTIRPSFAAPLAESCSALRLVKKPAGYPNAETSGNYSPLTRILLKKRQDYHDFNYGRSSFLYYSAMSNEPKIGTHYSNLPSAHCSPLTAHSFLVTRP